MALENELYAQVVMILRKQLFDKNEKDKTKKYNFRGQLARTKYWLDFDQEWLKENSMKREPDFYKNYIKLNLGVIIQKSIKYLEYQLVMQK